MGLTDLIDFWEFLKKGTEGQPCGPPWDFAGPNRKGTRISPTVPQIVEKVLFCQKWDGKKSKKDQKGMY